ncbi:hypothetical protein CBQ28_23505 [Pseudoalteromonas sp. GCY]|uniref:hypothetical protein n=1 Tax=Pseudoalteromonas sp. GCY TaxID=2003316 RepID=UPI000BFED104|nr:hypothetical protein [Pseudoalteromonas sp. GCY]PHI34676.1 hypothetical protein CBQ28_23505 [Pseudoalteromonas sp. GCY]QQQ64721.1 hypothetical protein JJQ94_03675 [Pseudoalteromonas sp. GCY]
MHESISNLSNLIRKVDTNFHNPRVHGEGFVVTWNKKTNQIVTKQGLLSDLFNKKHYEYFFVKSHTKPIVISKIPFEWHEGASEIALEFYATFQLKITDQTEAHKLVEILSMSGTPEKGLFNLIDKHLHHCMSKMYKKCLDSQNSNLLDEFYQQELQRGESSELNTSVCEQMQQELKGMDFNIGFTLRNAPERYAEFKYSTKIKETGLEVTSECQMTLNNYQAYRKSEISDIEGVVAHMKAGIERAIRQHILGKSEMDLLSNFKTATSQDVSISDQVKNSVKQQATAIGYELNSFHTLPNIAPLRLLNGLMLTFDKEDGAFKTGMFGSRVRLNIRMEVKAKEGEFEKYRHLFASSENDNQIDLLAITQAQILDRIKVLVHDICKEVMLNDKFNHYKALSQFEELIRPQLEDEIGKLLSEQHGLVVSIKSLMAVESEDAMRLEELRGKKIPIQFKHFFGGQDGIGAEYSFSGAFEVLGLVVSDAGGEHSWETFEKWDFGYRIDSPERHTNTALKGNDDRVCKKLAIENELEDIKQEVIRLFKASTLLIPSITLWVNKREYNAKLQDELLCEVSALLRRSRGMDLLIERLEIKDESLIQAQLDSRDRKLKSIADVDSMRLEQRLVDLKQSKDEKQKLADEVTERRLSFLRDSDDFEDLLDEKERIENDYRHLNTKESTIEELLPAPNSHASSDIEELADVLTKSNNQWETNDEK